MVILAQDQRCEWPHEKKLFLTNKTMVSRQTVETGLPVFHQTVRSDGERTETSTRTVQWWSEQSAELSRLSRGQSAEL